MSTLRSTVEELAAEDLDTVDDQAVETDLVEIHHAIEALEAQFLRRVATVDQRRSFERGGILSTTAFLTHHCQMAGSTAREKVRVARAIAHMPATRAAFTTGDLSYAKARMLATARETNPDVFTDHEGGLVEAIVPLTVRQARVAVEQWRNAAAPAAAVDRMEEMHEQRRLSVSASFEGMIHIEGMVDPVGGAYLTTALDAITAGTTLSDARASLDGFGHRSPAQRRMDGLVEICRQWLANGAPESGGERPHLNVTIDLPTLEHRTGRRCTVNDKAIDAESARMLACDAGVSRIITTGDSMPLDVGRRTRTIPPAVRTALVVRDGGCRFPGCDRPASWTDGHHITHWAEGGPTSVDNLVLVCRRHHTLIHRRGFRVDHDLVFHRPDGTPLPDG